MYSMVLVMSMAGAPEVPQFGWNKHGCQGGGCYGSGPVATQSYSSGCYGGCGGHGHGLFGGKLMNCFSGFKHKSNGCYGSGNGCYGGQAYSSGGQAYSSGGVIYTQPAPGCGTVVIPPTPGTVVPHTEVVPGTETPKVTPPLKDMPKPVDPPKTTTPPKVG